MGWLSYMESAELASLACQHRTVSITSVRRALEVLDGTIKRHRLCWLMRIR